MTSTFPAHHSDTQIFVLSALGSLLLHGLLMASLASMPQSIIVQNEPPTVQVRLLPSPEVIQTLPPPTPSQHPHTIMRESAPPAMPPLTQLNRSQAPAPPLQTNLTPSPPVKRSLLPPPVPVKPILKDIRASEAMKARAMMKMREQTQGQQTAPSLPTMNRRTKPENRSLPPLPMVTKKHSAARSLPAPPTLTASRTLTATPPAHTEMTMTRPTIMSSSKPVYPRVARESGWEGTVIIRTLIDTNGIPSQVSIRKSCGHPTLDQAAHDAVKSWIFKPAKDGNIPIAKWVDIPINFDLNS